MSEWKEDILSKKVDLIHGHQFRDNDFVEDGIPIIKIGQLKFNGQIDLTNCSYIDRKNLEKFKDYLIYQGDVLMALTGATLGKTVRVTKDFGNILQNYRVGKFLPIDDTINKDFIYYLLTSSFVQNEMLAKINTAAQGNIGKADFKRIKIRYPSYKNQQKIAKILTTYDTVIEQTQSAIAKYKAIKQGLLHDLFTRGLDANGHLRPSYQQAPELYKESELGMIPKEWEVDNFEGATEIITDFTANGSFESLRVNVNYYYESNYGRLIRLTDLRVNLKNEGVYVDKVGFDFLSKSELRENDLMLANVGEYTGYTCLMPKVNYPATIAPNMFLVRCNCEKFTAQFMYYFMTLDAFTRQVDNISASSATKLLNKTNFRKLSILRPDLKEQKIIGKILKNIDNKIQTEETLLQKYQSIKRGLMGDLLGGRKEV
jgi:type I restriction enzyme S subunit